jgi:DNA-binding Lrp family transcriptional regulator
MAEWGFITNHGLVLATIAKHPRSSTAREIGDEVGITERAAHNIINDLEADGYVEKNKVGRQNHYRINPDMPLKNEIGDADVGELLMILGWKRRKRNNRNNYTNSTKGKKG